MDEHVANGFLRHQFVVKHAPHLALMPLDPTPPNVLRRDERQRFYSRKGGSATGEILARAGRDAERKGLR